MLGTIMISVIDVFLTGKPWKIAYALTFWNKEVFGFCNSRIKELEIQLKLVQGHAPSNANLALEKDVLQHLNEWFERPGLLLGIKLQILSCF